ncbi:MAG: hypothetical protein AVDCRST_MAG68-3713, partial [uncultured Gemmatimonadetes bacterium]
DVRYEHFHSVQPGALSRRVFYVCRRRTGTDRRRKRRGSGTRVRSHVEAVRGVGSL